MLLRALDAASLDALAFEPVARPKDSSWFANPFDGQLARTKMLKIFLSVLAGALVGYGYHRLVGCRTGTCPITANPYISTLYGAVVGLLASGAGR